MNWHIGQEIVCIKSHSQGKVKKGNIYTVKGITRPCCSILLDVGVRSRSNTTFCTCDTPLHNNGIWWISESLFAPLEYDKQAIEELLENTLVKTS